jgi:hypothetical protein
MGGVWREYSFEFYDASCNHVYEDGVCKICGALNPENIYAENGTVSVNALSRTDIKIPVNSFQALLGSALELKTSIGNIVFDSTAVSDIFSNSVGSVTFEMRDLTQEAPFVILI